MALVSEVFEQHLGGHILQVRPLPRLLLLAATWWLTWEKGTLLSSLSPGPGRRGGGVWEGGVWEGGVGDGGRVPAAQNWEAGCWGSPFFLLLPRAAETLYP